MKSLERKKVPLSYADLLPENIGVFSITDRELIRDRAKICIKCSNLSKLDLKCVKCDCSFPAIITKKDKQCPIYKW